MQWVFWIFNILNTFFVNFSIINCGSAHKWVSMHLQKEVFLNHPLQSVKAIKVIHPLLFLLRFIYFSIWFLIFFCSLFIYFEAFFTMQYNELKGFFLLFCIQFRHFPFLSFGFIFFKYFPPFSNHEIKWNYIKSVKNDIALITWPTLRICFRVPSGPTLYAFVRIFQNGRPSMKMENTHCHYTRQDNGYLSIEKYILWLHSLIIIHTCFSFFQIVFYLI